MVKQQKLGERGEVGPSWAWHGREGLAGSGQSSPQSGMAAAPTQEHPRLVRGRSSATNEGINSIQTVELTASDVDAMASMQQELPGR